MTVTDNGKGQLEAAVSGNATIANSYKANKVEVDTDETDAEFAKKVVTGTGFEAKKFEFSMIEVADAKGTALDGAKAVTASLTFDAAGTKAVDFGVLTYDEVGTHYYKIVETTVGEGTGEGKDGWTTDNDDHIVTVHADSGGRSAGT